MYLPHAHFQLTSSPDGDGPNVKLTVDGVDLTRAVLAEGFRIEPHPILSGQFRVHMTLRARIDVDLPDAVIAAIQQPSVVDTILDVDAETNWEADQ